MEIKRNTTIWLKDSKNKVNTLSREEEIFVDCTEEYKEHIEYTFNVFCRIVIRYAALNAWRERSRRRQREVSFEYLTEEKYHPLSALDGFFINPYEV